MYTFITNLAAYLRALGIPYTRDLAEDYDILFVNSWTISHRTVRQVKHSRPEVRVVQRVDGSGWDYGRRDNADERQAWVNLQVDLTIFQSLYSRYSTMQKFPVIGLDGPVIYNPVDTVLYTPHGPRYELEGNIRVATVKNSANPFKGEKELYQIAQQCQDVDFYLMGCFENMPSLPNLHYLGFLDRDQVSVAFRSCHVFLNLSRNDPCPNVVLEALASGLPVLYKESGGVPELVGKCGLPVTVESFRQQLTQVMSQHGELSLAARNRAVNEFSPEVVFPQYMAAIQSCVRRPLPGVTEYIALYRRVLPMKIRRWLYRWQHES